MKKFKEKKQFFCRVCKKKIEKDEEIVELFGFGVKSENRFAHKEHHIEEKW